MGKKWSEIAKLIGLRTENAVKNRWKSLIKKYNGEFKRQNPKIIVPSIGDKDDSSDEVFKKIAAMVF